MAKIPKSGIANTQTIQASHITNIIEALDGTGSYDIAATGSFTGSFTGDGSNITGVTAEWDGTHVGDASITGSLDVTGDVTASAFSGSGVGITGVVSSSYAISSSYSVSSSLAASASRAENIATANLTLDGDHTHTLGGSTLQIGGTGTIKLSPDTLVTTASFNHSGSFTIIDSQAVNRFDVIDSRTTFNSSGADVDFRVHTDSDSNAFFVEGGTDRVGIGTDTPAAKLEVSGNIIATSFSGSFSGSFQGDGSGLTGVGGDSFPYTGSAIISGSLEVIGSVSGRLNKDSITIDNSTGISGNVSGSGIYPGMIVSVDLSQSTTNIVLLSLSPIAEYELGARFEFYLAASPGASARIRVDTDGTATYQGHILATANNLSTAGTTRIFSNAGAGSIGDRIIITKISDDYWALGGDVRNGNDYTAS